MYICLNEICFSFKPGLVSSVPCRLVLTTNPSSKRTWKSIVGCSGLLSPNRKTRECLCQIYTTFLVTDAASSKLLIADLISSNLLDSSLFVSSQDGVSIKILFAPLSQIDLYRGSIYTNIHNFQALSCYVDPF